MDAAIEVVPFTMDHYDAAMALWRRCEGMGLGDADLPDSIRAYFERNPGLSFVALCNGVLVGAVLCGHDGRRGYLNHCAVDSRHRRKGIGTAMVNRCLDALRAAGIQRCHLLIFANNAAGKAFWAARGWREYDDIDIMSRPLA